MAFASRSVQTPSLPAVSSGLPVPNCNESGERAIVITTEKGLFYCFAGKKGGDAIELVCHVSQKNANSLPRDSPPRFHCHLQKFSTILFLLWGNNHYKCKAEHL